MEGDVFVKGETMQQVLDYAKEKRRWPLAKMAAITTLAMVCLVGGVASWEALRSAQSRMRGRAEAELQWKTGTAVMYGYGLRRFGNDVDVRTGLHYMPIAGCMVNAEITNRAAAHNERIHALIARDGLPAYSWLRREIEICEPALTWTNRVAAGEVPVKVGNVAVEVRSGTAGRTFRLRVPAGKNELEIDGKLATYAGYLPTEGLEVMGGVKDDKVLYFKSGEPGREQFHSVEIDGKWVQLRADRVP